jgi:prevent-host-death family protein
MTEVASRELRNNTRGLLGRVEAGEEVVITVDGRRVATLQPVGSRPQWMPAASSSGGCSRTRPTPGWRTIFERWLRTPRTTCREKGRRDASVFIARESGRPLDEDRLPDEVAISAITIGELRADVLAAVDLDTSSCGISVRACR